MSGIESSLPRCARRDLLIAAGSLVAAWKIPRHTLAEPPAPRAAGTFEVRRHPQVTNPRATDGDLLFEPEWDERLTLTVGPQQGDLQGDDDRVLQAAVDYIARLGGGTVRILPGTYTLRNSIFLPSGIRVQGNGSDTVITKCPSERVRIVADSDWYDREITLEAGHGLRVGDGIVIQARNPHDGGATVIKRTLTARAGQRFQLNEGLRDNIWLSGDPTCASLFPLFTSEHTQNVVIENLTLDGNRENNERLDGNYGGCIFLQDCRQYFLRRIEARNNHGDGICFQICHDVVVEECHSHGHADLGIHPGSGSQRPLILNNLVEQNGTGLFWCWGVKYGLAEGNRIRHSRDYGISIGHNDTDNVMRNNEIVSSGRAGVLFRDEDRGQDFWPHRNTLEGNRIIDSGDEHGVAIDIQGRTRDVVIRNNEIRETRRPLHRVGIRISDQTRGLVLEGNTIEGFATPLVDLRT